MQQPNVVDNPFWVRTDRRIDTYGAATSSRRGVATLRFIDITKKPWDPRQSRRWAVMGDVLACFVIFQDWDRRVASFAMGEGKTPVTEADPAVDASAPVISHLVTGDRIWTTCLAESPTSISGKKALTHRESQAEADGCQHQVFTWNDGWAARHRLENYCFLNPMLQRVPAERYDCRYELSVIRDALRFRETTTMEYLQSAAGVSVAKMQGMVARLLHSGDLEPVNDFDREKFSLVSNIRFARNN
jgi:hypothetical protein